VKVEEYVVLHDDEMRGSLEEEALRGQEGVT